MTITRDVQLRVRYAETDQMGYVYYGNYATYLEVGRVEMLRALGISYKEMEEHGVMMPVIEYKTRYFKPAKYDNLLTIRVTIKEKPSVRIIFEYDILNEEGILLNKSETTLVFVNKETGKPCPLPDHIAGIFSEYFIENSEVR